MKITTFCPISIKKIDEHVARLNGGFTIIFLVLFILTQNILPILFLFADFALRSGNYSRFSPLTYLSRNIAKLLKLKPVLINAGPKIFAARIGFVLSILSIVLLLSNAILASQITIAVLALFAFLEWAMGFCMGCYIYSWIILPYFSKH